MLPPHQPDFPDTIRDVFERMAGVFGNCAAGGRIPAFACQTEPAIPHLLHQLVAVELSSTGRRFDREFDKIPPERLRSPGIIGMKCMGGPLQLPRFVRRSLGREVEMQDLEPRQQPPDRLGVTCRAGIRQMRLERIDEPSHVVVGRVRALDPGRECIRGAHLPCPGQNVPDRTLNIERCPPQCDGQFMTPVEETRPLRCLGNLGDNISKSLVGLRETEATLGLDFENSGTAVGVTGANDNVVKRMTLWCPLELDAFNPRARQPARFCAIQQGQQVVAADLPFETGTRRSGGCRTAHGH